MDTKRLLFILTRGIGVIIVVLALLQMSGIWVKALYVFEPLTGVLLLLQTIQNWHGSRIAAILSLCSALLIFGVAFWMYFRY